MWYESGHRKKKLMHSYSKTSVPERMLIRIVSGITIVLLAFSVTANPVNTRYVGSTQEFTLNKVPDAPVYYVEGQSGIPGANNEGFTSNAGFVVTDKGVVVYDALGTPVLGDRLLKEIRKVTKKPVTLVVVGHYHADHIYGLQAFREQTKATIWAQRDASGYYDSPNAGKRLAQRREALFPWVDENTFIVKPDQKFKDRHTFDMGDTKIELIHAGPAHALDDTILVVHKYGVVFFR